MCSDFWSGHRINWYRNIRFGRSRFSWITNILDFGTGSGTNFRLSISRKRRASQRVVRTHMELVTGRIVRYENSGKEDWSIERAVFYGSGPIVAKIFLCGAASKAVLSFHERLLSTFGLGFFEEIARFYVFVHIVIIWQVLLV